MNELVRHYRERNPEGLTAEQLGAMSDDDITRYLSLSARSQGVDLSTFPEAWKDLQRIEVEDRKRNATVWGELKGGIKTIPANNASLTAGALALGAGKLAGAIEDPNSVNPGELQGILDRFQPGPDGRTVDTNPSPVSDALDRFQQGARGIAKPALNRAKEALVNTAINAQVSAANLHQPAVENFTDISMSNGVKGSVSDFLKFAAVNSGALAGSIIDISISGAVGAAAGTTVPVIGNIYGGIAGMLGKSSIKTAIKRATSESVKAELESLAKRKIAREALSAEASAILGAATKNTIQKVGGILGSAASRVKQNAGESYLELHKMAEDGFISEEDALNYGLMAGLIKGGLDTALPGKLATGLADKLAFRGIASKVEKAAAVGYISKFFKSKGGELLSDTTLEGGTEAVQSLVDIAAKRWAKSHGKPEALFAPLTKEEQDDLINSFAVGAGGGAGMHVLAKTAERIIVGPKGLEPKTDSARDGIIGVDGKPVPRSETPAPAAVSANEPAATPTKDPAAAESSADAASLEDLANRQLNGDDVDAEVELLSPEQRAAYTEILGKISSGEMQAVAPKQADSTSPTDQSPPLEIDVTKPLSAMLDISLAHSEGADVSREVDMLASSMGVAFADGATMEQKLDALQSAVEGGGKSKAAATAAPPTSKPQIATSAGIDPEGKRPMVTVDVEGVPMVFYRSSSGTSGKTAGSWYPMFGFGAGGWLIKGTVVGMENGYGHPAIKAAMDQLNSQYSGTAEEVTAKLSGEFGGSLSDGRALTRDAYGSAGFEKVGVDSDGQIDNATGAHEHILSILGKLSDPRVPKSTPATEEVSAPAEGGTPPSRLDILKNAVELTHDIASAGLGKGRQQVEAQPYFLEVPDGTTWNVSSEQVYDITATLFPNTRREQRQNIADAVRSAVNGGQWNSVFSETNIARDVFEYLTGVQLPPGRAESQEAFTKWANESGQITGDTSVKKVGSRPPVGVSAASTGPDDLAKVHQLANSSSGPEQSARRGMLLHQIIADGKFRPQLADADLAATFKLLTGIDLLEQKRPEKAFRAWVQSGRKIIPESVRPLRSSAAASTLASPAPASAAPTSAPTEVAPPAPPSPSEKRIAYIESELKDASTAVDNSEQDKAVADESIKEAEADLAETQAKFDEAKKQQGESGDYDNPAVRRLRDKVRYLTNRMSRLVAFRDAVSNGGPIVSPRVVDAGFIPRGVRIDPDSSHPSFVAGYATVNGDSPTAVELAGLVDSASSEAEKSQDGHPKEETMYRLGNLLAANFQQKRVSGQSTGKTRRVTVWTHPSGRTLMTGTFRRENKAKTANSTFRFSVTGKGGKGARNSHMGIVDMFNDGWRPYATMALISSRENPARMFSGVDEFNAEFGHLSVDADEAGKVYSGVGTTAMSDGEVTPVDQSTPESVTSMAMANLLSLDGVDTLLTEVDSWVRKHFNPDVHLDKSGDVTPVFQKLFDGQFGDRFSEIIGAIGDAAAEAELTSTMEGEMLSELVKIYGRSRSDAVGAEARSAIQQVQGPAPTGSGSGGTQAGNDTVPPAEGVQGALSSGKSRLLAQIEDTRRLGGLSDADAQALNGMVGESASVDDLSQVEAIAREYMQPPAHKVADPALPADIQPNGSIRPAEVVPESPADYAHNVRRAAGPGQQPVGAMGLLSAMNVAALTEKYGDLRQALLTIAEDFGDSFLGKLARLLASKAEKLNVVVKFTTETGHGPAATFQAGSNHITIHAGRHRNIGDLHVSILHEAIHAYVSRTLAAAAEGLVKPKSAEYVFAVTVAKLANDARNAGMKWQGSDGDSVEMVDEFIAYALTESEAARSNPTVFSKLIQSIHDLLANLFGDTPVRDQLYKALSDLIQARDNTERFNSSMAPSAIEVAGSAAHQSTDVVRNRWIDGAMHYGRDITHDASVDAANAQHAARSMLAHANYIQDVVANMVARFRAFSPMATKFHGKEVSDFVLSIQGRDAQTADQIRSAVNQALEQTGGSKIVGPETVSVGSLEQLNQAPSVMRQILTSLHRFREDMSLKLAQYTEEFNSGALASRIVDATTELAQLTQRYEDMEWLGGFAVREVRREVRGISNTAGSLKTLHAINPSAKQAEIAGAVASLSGNPDALINGIATLSTLPGVDWRTPLDGVKMKDIHAKVNAPGSGVTGIFVGNDANLAVAVTVLHRGKNPLILNMLRIRKSGKSDVFKSAVALAMSPRSDGHEQAMAMVGKLGGVGVEMSKALARVRSVRDKLKEDQALLTELAGFNEWSKHAIPVLDQSIRDVERTLDVEYGSVLGDSQWVPHHGATYYVPSSPTETPEGIFDGKNERTLMLGDGYDQARVTQDVIDLKLWLRMNHRHEGSAAWNTAVRYVEQLTQASADNADRNVRRGVSGRLIKLFGDQATRLERIGSQPARVAASKIRRFAAVYEAMLKSIDKKQFARFNRLQREAMKFSGQWHAEQFERQYWHNVLGYLESRPDLNPGGTEQEQEDAAIKEMLNYVDRMGLRIASKNGWQKVLEAWWRQGAAANRSVQESIRSNESKVRDELISKNPDKAAKLGEKDPLMMNGRVIFRRSIGSPLWTMSRSVAPSVSSWVKQASADKSGAWSRPMINVSGEKFDSFKQIRHVRDLLADDAAQSIATGTPVATNENSLRAQISARFDRDAVRYFVSPMATKTGESMFPGPKVNGVQDRAPRSVVQNAYLQAVKPDGSMDAIAFADSMFAAAGGDPDTRAEYVAQTLQRFQEHFDTIYEVTNVERDDHADDSIEVARSFLDARQGDQFPLEHLSYRSYGLADHIRMARVIAANVAFGGRLQSSILQDFNKTQAELDDMATKVKGWKETDPDQVNALIRATGKPRAYENAAKNLYDLDRIRDSFRMLMIEMGGGPQSIRSFVKMVGMIGLGTVQGIGTAVMDQVSLVSQGFLKFGFTPEAVAFGYRNVKGEMNDVMASFAQMIGLEWFRDGSNEWHYTRYLNRGGAADADALSDRRGVHVLMEKIREQLGNEETLLQIAKNNRDEPVKAARELFGSLVNRANAGFYAFMDMGVGRAKSAEQAAVTPKIQAPFSTGSAWSHRGVARQFLALTQEMVDLAADYFENNPADMADQKFKLNAKHLGQTGRSLLGIKLDDRSFLYMSDLLERSMISLEESARKTVAARKAGSKAHTLEQALTWPQIQSVIAWASSEVLLNSGPTTRPGWMVNSTLGRVIAPISGWGISRIADVAKSVRNPDGTDMRHIGAWTNWALGVMAMSAASLAFSAWRDWFDDQLLHKHRNVLPLNLDGKPGEITLALVDRLASTGAFGEAGNIANSMINYSTARPWTIDSRVFSLSALKNLSMALASAVKTKDWTYQNSVRPMLMSMGGAGFLQNFDLINNLAGMDNMEARIIRRIHVNNSLKAAGRSLGMEVRDSALGLGASPNPVRPRVYRMYTAAISNDAEEFRNAMMEALSYAAQSDEAGKPGGDPYEIVAQLFKGLHPISSSFKAPPTSQQYQELLRQMSPRNAADVAEAIRLYNFYAQQVRSKAGGPGLKPYMGKTKVQPQLKRSWQYLVQ